jgi:hypothetical protein
METKKAWVLGTLAILGGMAGGMLGAYLFSAVPAKASEAQPVARTLRVQDLQIVDAAGRVRAELSVERDGLARLSFLTEHGKRRMAMGVLGDGEPAFGMYDSVGNPRIGLNIPPDDSAGVRLVDGKGRSRLRMSELEDGSTSVELIGESGKVIWEAPHHGVTASADGGTRTASLP